MAQPATTATPQSRKPHRQQSGGKKLQVDYREVLNEEDFAVYSELRELSKRVAQQENVAVYVVQTGRAADRRQAM